MVNGGWVLRFCQLSRDGSLERTQRMQWNALHESAVWWGMERITAGGKVSAMVFRPRACVLTVNRRCWDVIELMQLALLWRITGHTLYISTFGIVEGGSLKSLIFSKSTSVAFQILNTRLSLQFLKPSTDRPLEFPTHSRCQGSFVSTENKQS